MGYMDAWRQYAAAALRAVVDPKRAEQSAYSPYAARIAAQLADAMMQEECSRFGNKKLTRDQP